MRHPSQPRHAATLHARFLLTYAYRLLSRLSPPPTQRLKFDLEPVELPDPPVELPANSLWGGLVNREIVKIPEIATVPKRKRGRPRKWHLPVVEGKTVYKLSDDDPPFRLLSFRAQRLVEQDFKQRLNEGQPTREALEEVCKLHYLSYPQAHRMLSEHL